MKTRHKPHRLQRPPRQTSRSRHRRSTSQSQVLSDGGAHPRNVHVSWPTGQIKRMSYLSSSLGALESSISAFLERLEQRCPEHEGLHAARSLATRLNLSHPTQKLVADTAGSWVVLPFRDCWARARVGKILKDSLQKSFAIDPTAISPIASQSGGVAWRLGYPHVLRLVSSFNRWPSRCSDC